MSKFYDEVVRLNLGLSEQLDLTNASEISSDILKVLGPKFKETIERYEDNSAYLSFTDSGGTQVRIDAEDLLITVYPNKKPMAKDGAAVKRRILDILKKISSVLDDKKYKNLSMLISGYYVPEGNDSPDDDTAVMAIMQQNLSPQRPDIIKSKFADIYLSFEHHLGSKVVEYTKARNKKKIFAIGMNEEISFDGIDDDIGAQEACKVFSEVDIDQEFEYEYEALASITQKN